MRRDRMTHRACSLSRTTRRLLTVLALLVAAVAVPGVANASVATRIGTQISIVAGAGETNDILFKIDCCFYSAKITDTAGITAAGECTQVSATAVDCGQFGTTKPDVVVQLGDGNDTFVADELFNVRSFKHRRRSWRRLDNRRNLARCHPRWPGQRHGQWRRRRRPGLRRRGK